ncbi:hypothetical protein TRFO_36338 [Tritrichomonas foetus]|uniref:UDENN domain-containing protein n=1 Tax=Tritrichomonas foetus TaxID=1144522 RepID=A0A1J4JE92_9EUKA|nr:hypothetical protein TRFO_36338 [Tritrichomonas foetus]|eukprot:OHS97474.1 hypothetical protein TRFO_36338 [Tritrichomonas foetus]
MSKPPTTFMSVSVFLFEFDIKSGPLLLGSITDHDFTDDHLRVLTQSAFPESTISNINEKMIFFTFTLQNPTLFCFSLYIRTSNPNLPRFHQQDTFIIVTDLPYYTPFYHFLMSSMSLIDSESMTFKDILEIFGDFAKKWVKQLPAKRVDLPMFVSSLPVAAPAKATDFFEEIGIYLISDTFMDIDICSALGVHTLMKLGKTKDILKLWEISLLGEDLVVFGANANFASNAVLAITSLSFPIIERSKDAIFPYVSFTDSRNHDKSFLQSLKTKTASNMKIIGISNPMLIDLYGLTYVFNIGFAGQNSSSYEEGLLNSRSGKWNFLSNVENVTSKIIRKQLYENTVKVINVIKNAFFDLCELNPYEAINGNLDIDAIAAFLYEYDVDIVMDYDEFAQKLIYTKFSKRICTKLSKDPKMEKLLAQFPIIQHCQKLDENNKIELYAQIDDYKKIVSDNEKLLSIVEKHQLAVKLSITPDLINAEIDTPQ